MVGLFAWPLWEWARFAAADELQSHLLCVPLMSIYLLAQKRKTIRPGAPSPRWVAVWLTAGAFALGLYLTSWTLSYPLKGSESLTFGILAFVCGVQAIALGTMGLEGVRPVLFPLGFLFGMVPLPTVAITHIQGFLQQSSGAALSALYHLTGIQAQQHGLSFQLSTITIEIAQECSGIHSTLVLVYTALCAGYLFLRNPWHRAILVAVTIPLGILRNAVRIWVLSWLCIHISPDMIDSTVHHRGGPVFYALTVGLLALIVVVLRRRETRQAEVEVGRVRLLPNPN